jgi:O-antigen/teichoic acid export membrane protein
VDKSAFRRGFRGLPSLHPGLLSAGGNAEIKVTATTEESRDFAARVRSAVFWRSGSQIVAQLVMWASTFLVIRLLQPSDYGLFAMTQIVLSLMSLMNGYSFTGALVQAGEIDSRRVSQVFGMLILMNFGLAAAQFLLAPSAATYFRQPIVADMLRVQSLLHIFTPFIMMPQALLSRRIDFRTQARANLAAAVLAALVALGCAYAGLGVWTLIAAPMTLFGARAIGLAIIGRWWIWPSFRFAGAGATLGFGGAMLLSETLWFVQTQADVFIAGRVLDAHSLGIYTTALFLSQILINKFLPPLNEVAFPAYARLQDDRAAAARAFLKAARIIMLVALPFGVGLALTAEPLVLTVLGEKWVETGPVVAILGLAVPFIALRTIYQPATNALGRPGIMAMISGAGAVIMPISFLIGVRYGAVGMAWAWLGGFPLLTLIASILSLPVIGVRAGELLVALRPALVATAAMAVAVIGLDQLLPAISPLSRLALLVATGGSVYVVALLATARGVIDELITLLARRKSIATG